MIEYMAEADAQVRHDRKGNRVQDYVYGDPWDPETNPTGFRAYVTLGKYGPRPIVTRRNVFGRLCWFTQAELRILEAVLRELKAGHELHTGTIAAMARVSRGYASKVIGLLSRLRFIEIEQRIRGRFGRIIAAIVNVSTIRTRSSYMGGNIEPKPKLVRHDYRWKVDELRQFERDMELAGW